MFDNCLDSEQSMVSEESKNKVLESFAKNSYNIDFKNKQLNWIHKAFHADSEDHTAKQLTTFDDFKKFLKEY